MTKKGSFIPKVCFSSPGQAMKMVDTCDVPNIMERDYECRRSFLHSFPWFREQMTGYPCQLFFWCGHSGIFCPKFGAVGFRYCTGWKGIHSAGERYIRLEFTVRDPKASNMRLVRSPGMYFLHTRKQNGWRMSVVRKRKEKSFDKARPIASHSSAWVRKIAAILTEHRVKVRLRPNANGVFWESDGRDWHKLRFAWDGPEVRIGPSRAVDVGLFNSVTIYLAYSRSAAASFLMTRKSLSFGYSVLGWGVLVLRKSSWT